MAPSKANSPEYAKDEKVLCFHLELLYEAKVLDSKPKDPNDKGDGYVYKIHYKGWKNTYVCLLLSSKFRVWSSMNRARWQ
jgi:mortality factor 4-like protein 1